MGRQLGNLEETSLKNKHHIKHKNTRPPSTRLHGDVGQGEDLSELRLTKSSAATVAKALQAAGIRPATVFAFFLFVCFGFCGFFCFCLFFFF